MRFSTAWAKVAAQNVTLKVATVVLAVVSSVQLIIIGQVANRDPLVVERSCYSKIVEAKASVLTNDEIKSFLSESLPMRFDSNGYLKPGFLSLSEAAQRDQELQVIKQRQMLQRILISDITIAGKNITVAADRLISIGKVKSALPLTLKVVLEQTIRTESNPYGLILTNASQVAQKEINQ